MGKNLKSALVNTAVTFGVVFVISIINPDFKEYENIASIGLCIGIPAILCVLCACREKTGYIERPIAWFVFLFLQVGAICMIEDCAKINIINRDDHTIILLFILTFFISFFLCEAALNVNVTYVGGNE